MAGILAAITGEADNAQTVVETNDAPTDNTQIAAIDPNMSAAELEALETSVVTGQLRRRTIIGADADDGSRDGAGSESDDSASTESTIAAAVTDDNETESDAGIGAGILAGLLGTDETSDEG